MCFGYLEHKLSIRLWEEPLASILSVSQLNFFGCGHKKWPKTAFFAKFSCPRHFCEENFSRIGPCEISLPEVSENVVLLGRASFLTGVIAAQSQQTLKFSVRHQK